MTSDQKPVYEGSPFFLLMNDPVHIHLLEVFLTKGDLPVTLDGLKKFTGDSQDEIEDAIELLLDINLIEQSHDGTQYRLSENDTSESLREFHLGLYDHVSRIHEETDYTG